MVLTLFLLFVALIWLTVVASKEKSKNSLSTTIDKIAEGGAQASSIERVARYISRYHYRRKTYLITKHEHELFSRLHEIYGGNYYIFPQVHLSTILDHKIHGQNWQGALSVINRKSVDFVICDKIYLRPLVAIELDDWTHGLEDRKSRDNLVETIFAQADMPLVRFESSDADEATIRTKIDPNL